MKTAPEFLPVHLSIHLLPPSPTAAVCPAESPAVSANGAEDGALCLTVRDICVIHGLESLGNTANDPNTYIALLPLKTLPGPFFLDKLRS